LFARNIAISLKPNSVTEFAQKLEDEEVPILRKQGGFRDMIFLLSDDNIYVHAISLWESRQNAEAYKTTAYAEVLKSLETIVTGKPRVRASTVVHSTMQVLTPTAAAA
jgi:heme-degrading monooxygenase HmoA